MFDPLSEKKLPVFSPGMGVHGVWQGYDYKVVRLLGQGANGSVYLIWRGHVQAALKIGPDATALALEFTHLQTLATEADGVKIGPCAYELDDVSIQGQTWSILIMEYVEGTPVDQFVDQYGVDWVPLCLLKIVRVLKLLHNQGYNFCDLKPSNILIDSYTANARFVDFGGVTKHHAAVKEFTETFDRAWWGRGSRKADPQYDLFALGMLGIHLTAPVPRKVIEYLAKKTPVERDFWLDDHLRTHRQAHAIMPLLVKMVAVRSTMDSETLFAQITAILGRKEGTSVKIESSLTLKKTRHRFDATDWWLLAAVLIFVSVLFVLLWVGRS